MQAFQHENDVLASYLHHLMQKTTPLKALRTDVITPPKAMSSATCEKTNGDPTQSTYWAPMLEIVLRPLLRDCNEIMFT